MADNAHAELNEDVVSLTADIVSAFVSNNAVARGDLSELIRQVHTAVHSATNGTSAPAEKELTPAVPIKKSLTPDHIVCLEDGKKFKSLKRHLRTSFNLTPEEYRLKWGLPRDYPMVARNYAETRSALAKSMGLGNKRQKAKARSTPMSAKAATRKSAPKIGSKSVRSRKAAKVG